MVVDANHDPLVETCTADIHEETWIGFFVDQPVVLRTVAKGMEQHLGRTVVGIEAGVEKSVISGIPHAAATGIRNPVGQIVAVGEIADAKRVEFGTLVVEGPQKLAVIGRMVDTAEAEIGLAFGLEIAVEQDLLVAAVARRAEITRLLAAKLER